MIATLLLMCQSSMLTCDKTSRVHELQKVCSLYPEYVLTAAFESLKLSGIVASTKLVRALLLLCGQMSH